MKCTFPAADLLRTRREISEAKGIDVWHAAKIIDAIDHCRFKHEEETGCQCWAEAIVISYSRYSNVA